jgi:hypothetical protein
MRFAHGTTRRCYQLAASVPDVFAAPQTGVDSRIDRSCGWAQIVWASDYRVVLRQFVLDTIPYDLDNGTPFAPDEDWKACAASVGAALAQFGIDDEDRFADFDIYIRVASRLAKEVFRPMNKYLQSEPHPLRQGHRLLMVQFHATKVLAIYDSFSAFERCVILRMASGCTPPARATTSASTRWRWSLHTLPLDCPLRHGSWPAGRRPLVGKRKWWSDEPLNVERIRALQRFDLRLLVHSVLLLSNSLGDPTIDGIVHHPEPFMQTGTSSRWTLMSGAGTHSPPIRGAFPQRRIRQ